MKNFIALSVLALVVQIGFCQTEGEEEQPKTDTTQESDTTIIDLGDSKIIWVQKGESDSENTPESNDSIPEPPLDDADFTFWSGIDLGFTGVVVASGAENDWFDIREQNSSAFSINFIEKKIRLFKHHIGITTGLGATYQDYSFNDSLSIVNVDDNIMGVSSDGIEYSKNKLKTGFIKIPLLLEINTSKHNANNVHIAAGLIGGWNFRSALKQQFEIDGDKTRLKTKGDYNINPWSVEATVRAGYGDFNVFATASLTDLFEDGKGPEVQPFTIGVTLVNF